MDGVHMVRALGLLREAKGAIDMAGLLAGPDAGKEAGEMIRLISRALGDTIRGLEDRRVIRMGEETDP